MKTNHKTKWRATLLILAAGASANAFSAVNIELEVQNQGGSTVLVVTKNNARCPGGPIDCIEVAAGSQPHLFFTLKGGCDSTGYGLTAFRVAQAEKQWPTPQRPLKLEIAEDFCADEESGYVDFMACQNELRADKMKLKDFNRLEGSVFYEVTAAHCTDPAKEIFLDPQIKNKGGN
jgi:hypothetical protein